MTTILPQDTPIARATILDMTPEQLEAHIVSLQERRMRSYRLYEEAQAAKAAIKEEKDRARYVKVIEMLAKKLESAEKALDAANKYHNEIKILRLTVGDL